MMSQEAYQGSYKLEELNGNQRGIEFDIKKMIGDIDSQDKTCFSVVIPLYNK